MFPTKPQNPLANRNAGAIRGLHRTQGKVPVFKNQEKESWEIDFTGVDKMVESMQDGVVSDVPDFLPEDLDLKMSAMSS